MKTIKYLIQFLIITLFFIIFKITGLKIACLEEIVLNNKWITKTQLKK